MKVRGLRLLDRWFLEFTTQKKKPVYIGNVGTGFDQPLLESLLEKLKKIVVSKAPFECEPYKGRVTWVEPKLVCEVVYMAVTPDLSLRHPRFKGLRDDKTPTECTIDQILPHTAG